MIVAETFAEAHARPAEGVWRAPGRIEPIGEHTGHNGGLVLTFALAQGVSVAAARRDDDLLELRFLQAIAEPVFVRLGALAPGSVTGWAAHPAGVAWALRPFGVGGASLLFDADLPRGAGPGSSAALECATALALSELYGAHLDRPALARLVQTAAGEFAGSLSGVADRSAPLLCAPGHALLLDRLTGLSARVPLRLDGFAPLVIDTGVARPPAVSAHAERRASCERAAALLRVGTLREVKDLAGALTALRDPVLRRRVQHVVTENHRVEATAGLLRAGATGEVGALLTASHLSLRDQYEVSWPQADVAVEEAVRAGARGARMVGGGFGGSVLALVPSARVAEVQAAVTAVFAARGWAAPGFLPAIPSAGAARLR